MAYQENSRFADFFSNLPVSDEKYPESMDEALTQMNTSDKMHILLKVWPGDDFEDLRTHIKDVLGIDLPPAWDKSETYLRWWHSLKNFLIQKNKESSEHSRLDEILFLLADESILPNLWYFVENYRNQKQKERTQKKKKQESEDTRSGEPRLVAALVKYQESVNKIGEKFLRELQTLAKSTSVDQKEETEESTSDDEYESSSNEKESGEESEKKSKKRKKTKKERKISEKKFAKRLKKFLGA